MFFFYCVSQRSVSFSYGTSKTLTMIKLTFTTSDDWYKSDLSQNCFLSLQYPLEFFFMANNCRNSSRRWLKREKLRFIFVVTITTKDASCITIVTTVIWLFDWFQYLSWVVWSWTLYIKVNQTEFKRTLLKDFVSDSRAWV